MEDRYEIRDRIGQGGLGSVFRGFDRRMNRVVAIKRISRADQSLEEEAAKQLLQEAGALASLQHPNIVTIHDLGSDAEGPFVVMELIEGKTIDELINRAPLTWPDFKEFALQAQEALIAAHEIDIIHSDLKPSNLMLSWLPSGKFQVKIVDFGLAVLARSQDQEDIAKADEVFGSVYFMPPEQFERKSLDARSDLYSIGCVYYQALTGLYPFDGESVRDVMTAHLHHTVTPLQEHRPDLPSWVGDWVMWHINRQPEDRPDSAREALSLFLQNDKHATAKTAVVPVTEVSSRPRLIIPGSSLNPTVAATPEGPTSSAPALKRTGIADTLESRQSEPKPVRPEPTKTSSAPQPLAPPEGSKPSVHTSVLEIPEPEPAPPPASILVTGPSSGPQLRTSSATRTGHRAPVLPSAPARKKRLSNAAKTTIAAVLMIAVILLGWTLINRSGKNREIERYNELVSEAAKGDTVELPINSEDLDILLNAAAFTGATDQREVVYKALYLAKSTDATDVDLRIAGFVTSRDMLPDVRNVILRDVLRKRDNSRIVPIVLDFAKSTKEASSAVAAVEGVRFMAGDEHMESLLGILQSTTDPSVRGATEGTIAEIIKDSNNKSGISEQLVRLYQGSLNDDVRHSAMRLFGRAGGDKALDVVKSALSGSELKDQVAAITALSSWSDEAGYACLAEFIRSSNDPQLKSRAFDAALRHLTEAKRAKKPVSTGHWDDLADTADSQSDKEKLIKTIASYPEPWAATILERFANDPDERVQDTAERALRHNKQLKSGTQK